MHPFDRRLPYSEGEATASQQIELPPLRDMFPEINMHLAIREVADHMSQAQQAHEPQEPRERGSFSYYITSPTTERGMTQDEDEEGSPRSHVPRIYRGPRHRVPRSRQLSPSSRDSERWSAPARAFSVSTRSIPPPIEMKIPSPGPRVALPILTHPQVALPSLTSEIKFEDEPPSRPRELSRAYSYDFAMHHGTPSPIRPLERTSFSSSVFSTPHYHDAAHFENQEPITPAREARSRKRRGNLPRDTTDKLRAWFDDHLSHPYPTEDEKQEFIRRTGLQMNQISNWFINARRRYLPLIKKKMAEKAAAEAKAASEALQNGQAISSESNFAASPAISDGTAFSATSDGTIYSAASDGTIFSDIVKHEA